MLTLLTILLGVLVIGAIEGFVLHELLLGQLRVQHPDAWQTLGSPDRVFDDGGLTGFRAVRRLCREPDLRRRCSSEVVALIARTRAYGKAYMLLAIVTFAISMVCMGRML